MRRNGVVPVSYTHLDVYKRQTMDRAYFLGLAFGQPLFFLLWRLPSSASSAKSVRSLASTMVLNYDPIRSWSPGLQGFLSLAFLFPLSFLEILPGTSERTVDGRRYLLTVSSSTGAGCSRSHNIWFRPSWRIEVLLQTRCYSLHLFRIPLYLLEFFNMFLLSIVHWRG